MLFLRCSAFVACLLILVSCSWERKSGNADSSLSEIEEESLNTPELRIEMDSITSDLTTGYDLYFNGSELEFCCYDMDKLEVSNADLLRWYPNIIKKMT